MRKALFLLVSGGLIGAAVAVLTTGGWMQRAAQSFLMLLASSVVVFVLRELVIARIDKTNGNDAGMIALSLYAVACFLATAIATVAAMFLPHTGMINLVALGAVVLAALLTALMHR